MFHVLIVLAVVSRLLPHPPNFACIGALGLFAGCYLRGRYAPIFPLMALLISDIIGHVFKIDGMGFYSPVAMVGVYAGFAVAAMLGRLLRDRQTPLRIGMAALASSVVFFLCSNLGVWASGMYPPSWEGLVACYTAAVPFFRYTVMGDLIYSGALFGAFALVRMKMPQRYWGMRSLAS
ncbi:hypothetical protein FF011L_44880 [Roseimaritima multifibrata]|uniref:Rod shape-determining protein MreD n=1 Tax=Roseimaritima multifibrata TaxID=1930274 RepID=A0A517MLC0_9BACT|nr:DUF6580 family putative transport protein [Roseimaritima multifibrata]QDS95688.1 hypothetical protein FF011L_44880 [Roseimaritima multifibrata]